MISFFLISGLIMQESKHLNLITTLLPLLPQDTLEMMMMMMRKMGRRGKPKFEGHYRFTLIN